MSIVQSLSVNKIGVNNYIVHQQSQIEKMYLELGSKSLPNDWRHIAELCLQKETSMSEVR